MTNMQNIRSVFTSPHKQHRKYFEGSYLPLSWQERGLRGEVLHNLFKSDMTIYNQFIVPQTSFLLKTYTFLETLFSFLLFFPTIFADMFSVSLNSVFRNNHLPAAFTRKTIE